MPAKNTAKYIEEAVKSILESGYNDFELIVIDDNSQDNTYELVKKISDSDRRIKIYKNPSTGIVAGLNYGYGFSTGEIIKCIDSDDILSPEFFAYLKYHSEYNSICHDADIIDAGGKKLSIYHIDPFILNGSFEDCFKNLKTPPKWTWSYSRNIAEKIFPMPHLLPVDDVWFSLIIKRFSNKILHISKELYSYRQHNNQIFGGILNFGNNAVKHKANIALGSINVLRQEAVNRLEIKPDNLYILDSIEEFYKILAKDTVTLNHILSAKISLGLKTRALIYKKLSFCGSLALKLKWKFDRLRTKQILK